MTIHFAKMSGAGNDFVCVDNRKGKIRLTRAQIARLCDRHFGIGADGMLVVESGGVHHDFRMRYYNADGGEADMCGNGARCFARFAREVSGTDKPNISIRTGAGTVTAEFIGEDVRIGLTPPTDARPAQMLTVEDEEMNVHFINTGVPHAVVIVKDVETVDLLKTGAALRWHRVFQPKGTNVNFMHRISGRRLRVRTYERGVEGETLACGTGVTACALIAAQVFNIRSPLQLEVKGGATLEVHFESEPRGYANVKLQGPADFVFEGDIDV
jgi:diaminopimelate epimerase